LTIFPSMPGLLGRMSMKVITYLISYITTQLTFSLKCILPTLMEPMRLILPFFTFSVISLPLDTRIFMAPYADHYMASDIQDHMAMYWSNPFEKSKQIRLQRNGINENVHD